MEGYDPFYRYLLPFLTQVPMFLVLIGGIVAVVVRWAHLGRAAIPALIALILLVLLRISAMSLQSIVSAAQKREIDIKLIFGLNSILSNCLGAVAIGLLLYAVFVAVRSSAS